MPTATNTLSAMLDKLKASHEKAKVRKLYTSNARSFKRRLYQEEDILWMQDTKRAVLAWAPGLGKTFAACEAAEVPMIVSCPVNLVKQWIEFMEDQYPHWKIVDAAHGTFAKRDAAMKEPWDVLVINHDMFSRYFLPPCKTLVLDEYHHFRNKDAQRSKNCAVYVKANKVERVYGLTATPVYKDVGDLWHQLHILYPDQFESEFAFLDNYAVMKGGGWGNSVVKTRNERALKNLLKDYMREKTYKQVGMFLPDRIDKDIKLKLDPLFRKDVYDKLRLHFKLELEGMDEPRRFESAGAVLHMLRQILVNDEKLAAAKEIIDDIPEDRPVAVFCWYKDTAAKVADALGGVIISGDLTPDRRRDYALHGGPERKRVRVITMASLSEGVDMSFMRDVIFIEEDYVPGKVYQCMTRIQRARTEEGYDKDPVVAYWIRFEQTVDEIVHQTARSRTTGNALSVLKEALEGI